MKFFYLIVLTFLTITESTAAAALEAGDKPQPRLKAATLEQVAGKSVARRAGTPTSESGSYAGSYLSAGSTVTSRHTAFQVRPDLNRETLPVAFMELLKSYNDLVKEASAEDTRVLGLVGALDGLLGGIERTEAGEDSFSVLQRGFEQLTTMYNSLKKAYNKSKGKVELLESTVAELKAGQEALLATMAPRPTEHMATDMSPPRKAAVAAAIVDSSDVVAALRARNTELDDKTARLEAEIAALKAAATQPAATTASENAALKAAATKPVAKSSTGVSKSDVRDPLLSSEDSSAGGYTQLNDGPSAPRGKRGNDNGCPCVVQ